MHYPRSSTSTCMAKRPPTPEVKVVTYQKGTGVASNGSIVAPFDGMHGWYLQNQAERPVTVRLKLSGLYQVPENPYAAK